MDMHMLHATRRDSEAVIPTIAARTMTRDQLILRLTDVAGSPLIHSGLRALTDYLGASHYMLARCDLLQESGLDFVMSSDWPFDLVRRLASDLVSTYVRTTEFEKLLMVFLTSFSVLTVYVTLP